jgi:hypothetical protein
MHSRNKEHEKTQKQINELREDFNKHQSETKDTTKKEINKLKMTTQNRKEELNKDMENLRKMNQTEILEIKSPFSQINPPHYSFHFITSSKGMWHFQLWYF